jgi:hypothetical protein
MGCPIVTLDPWEYQWACHVGIARYTANWAKQDAPWYDKSRMEDDRTAQQAACIAEIAVAKHTNRYWSGSMWTAEAHDREKWRADVGTNIEVKRVRTRDAAVRKHQVGKGVVLWVARPVGPEFRTVEMWGWLPVDEAWELGDPADYDKKGLTRVIRRELLRQDLPGSSPAAA